MRSSINEKTGEYKEEMQEVVYKLVKTSFAIGSVRCHGRGACWLLLVVVIVKFSTALLILGSEREFDLSTSKQR